MKKRVAVASEGLKGLEDIVPQVFGRSPAFTTIDIENGVLKGTSIKRNPSANLAHGAGPLTCTRLNKLGVDTVIAAEFGPTVSSILQEAEITKIKVEPGTKVKDTIKQYLRRH